MDYNDRKTLDSRGWDELPTGFMFSMDVGDGTYELAVLQEGVVKGSMITLDRKAARELRDELNAFLESKVGTDD